jgi:hypothetical protein
VSYYTYSIITARVTSKVHQIANVFIYNRFESINEDN